MASVRDATLDDLDVLQALYVRSSLVWDEHRADLEAHPEVLVLDPGPVRSGRVRVAVGADSRLLGFSTVLPGLDATVELDALFVGPDLLRGGVGRRLVDDLATRARQAGARRVDVTANLLAVGFYEKVGFVGAGEVPTQFGPALRMHLDL